MPLRRGGLQHFVGIAVGAERGDKGDRRAVAGEINGRVERVAGIAEDIASVAVAHEFDEDFTDRNHPHGIAPEMPACSTHARRKIPRQIAQII